MYCSRCVWSLLCCSGGPRSNGERLPAGKAAVLDQLPQLRLLQLRVVVGNRGRLRDVAGLDRSDWRELAESLLNLTAAGLAISVLYGTRSVTTWLPCSRYHRALPRFSRALLAVGRNRCERPLLGY